VERVKQFVSLERQSPRLVPGILAGAVLVGLVAALFAEQNPGVFFQACGWAFVICSGLLTVSLGGFLITRIRASAASSTLGTGEVVRREGMAFGWWFAIHNLLWVCLVTGSLALLEPMGVQGWVAVLIAGGVAAVVVCLAGLCMVRLGWVLGLNWLNPVPADYSTLWAAVGSTLLLGKRYEYSVRMDSAREEPLMHHLVGYLNALDVAPARRAVRLWQDRMNSVRSELGSRLICLVGLFGLAAMVMVGLKTVLPGFNPMPTLAEISPDPMPTPGGGDSEKDDPQPKPKEEEEEARIEVPESIKLGDITRLQQKEDRVMLRIYPPVEGAKLPEDTYWRLMVLDQYRDGECSPSSSVQGVARGFAVRTEHELDYAGRAVPKGAGRFPGRWRLRYEPGFSRYVPAAGPYAVKRWMPGRAFHYQDGVYQCRLAAIPARPIEYEIEEMIGCEVIAAAPVDSRLNQFRTPIRDSRGQQSPLTNLDLSALSEEDFQALKAISSQITATVGRRDWEAWRDAAIEFLQKDRKYTQEFKIPRGQGGRDPVLRWIEDKQDGHCEYFSYAFMLLARAEGYPVRVVCGFSGADYSAKRKCFEAKLSVAHAWCEMFTGAEWVRVEPTPPAPPNSGGGSGGGSGQSDPNEGQGGGEGQPDPQGEKGNGEDAQNSRGNDPNQKGPDPQPSGGGDGSPVDQASQSMKFEIPGSSNAAGAEGEGEPTAGAGNEAPDPFGFGKTSGKSEQVTRQVEPSVVREFFERKP